MLLYVLPREGEVRVGFVASRRVGGAVVRNRARRRMKEAWRSLSPMATGGFDIVVSARQQLPGVDMNDLVTEMRDLLREAKVIPR